MISSVFDVLNWVAFFGWSFVSYKLLFLFDSSSETETIISDLQTPILALEVICAVEVVRILLGSLKGNFVLGIILHAIRLITVLETIPRSPYLWVGGAILGSWAATEIFRYPMYMFPSSQSCRSLRMVVPLVTFPIGAFCEAYGAYLVFVDPETPLALKVALAAVLFVNGVLGPTMAYPALLKKGLPILGLAKPQKRKEQ